MLEADPADAQDGQQGTVDVPQLSACQPPAAGLRGRRSVVYAAHTGSGIHPPRLLGLSIASDRPLWCGSIAP